MAEDGELVHITEADAVFVGPSSGGKTGVIFRLVDGQKTGVAVDHEMLSHLASQILRHAVTTASGQTDLASQMLVLNAAPIPVQALGLAKGRTETERFLSISLGPLALTFSVDATMLAGLQQGLRPTAQGPEPSMN